MKKLTIIFLLFASSAMAIQIDSLPRVQRADTTAFIIIETHIGDSGHTRIISVGDFIKTYNIQTQEGVWEKAIRDFKMTNAIGILICIFFIIIIIRSAIIDAKT